MSFKPSLLRAMTLLSESSFQNHSPKVCLFNLTSHVFLPKLGIQITKSTKKSLIYLFYKNVTNGPDGTLGDDGDVHYHCLHSSHKICMIKRSIGGLKVATYFIIIFYLIDFYCQIKISNRFLLSNYIIYFYLLNHLF